MARTADVRPGHRVLDVGCGTGTLGLRLAETAPRVQVAAVDRDPEMLARARRKRRDAGTGLALHLASCTDLPYPDRQFDRVLSSLLLHHLRPPEKHRTISEMRRVLRPGGRLVIADWGRPGNALERLAYLLAVQLLDGFETTADHVRGVLPRLVRSAGLDGVDRPARFATPAGPLEIWTGRRPAS